MRGSLLASLIALPVLSTGLAHAQPADRPAELLLGNNMVVIRLSTNDKDQLLDVAGTGAKGTVRCYTSATKVHDTGCYVGIKRNGTLAAPAFLAKGKTGDASPTLLAFAPAIESTYTASVNVDKTANPRVEIAIGGSVGAAISLYATCSSKGLLRCEDANGESYRHGKTDPVAQFTIVGGGKIVK